MIKLSSSIQEIHNSKQEISSYEDHLWKSHLNNGSSLDEKQITIDISKISNCLLPRHSRRATDTKVISLLHGHDLVFAAFKARVTNTCNPYCPNCSTLMDDNAHRIFVCPLYSCSYRETLLHLSTPEVSAGWSILSCKDEEVLTAFRNLAQITISY